jgi:hypothetical protein
MDGEERRAQARLIRSPRAESAGGRSHDVLRGPGPGCPTQPGGCEAVVVRV